MCGVGLTVFVSIMVPTPTTPQLATKCRRRASTKVNSNLQTQPLDEEDQQLIIDKFELDIQKQFRTLQLFMGALCVLWVSCMSFVSWKPFIFCEMMTNISMLFFSRPIECYSGTINLVQKLAALLVLSNVLSVIFLWNGNKMFLKTGYYSFSLPSIYVVYVYREMFLSIYNLVEGSPLNAANENNDAQKLDNAAKLKQDLNIQLLLLILWIMICVLFHYLCGNVYSTREDLRRHLTLLSSKKYRYKIL